MMLHMGQFTLSRVKEHESIEFGSQMRFMDMSTGTDNPSTEPSLKNEIPSLSTIPFPQTIGLRIYLS